MHRIKLNNYKIEFQLLKYIINILYFKNITYKTFNIHLNETHKQDRIKLIIS